MTTWCGPAFPGAMRSRREAKRAEAQARNAATPHARTRAHRQRCCECWEGPALASLPSVASRKRKQRPCPWPSKVAYATPQEAAWTQGKHNRHKRWRMGLNVYRCPSGRHYHAGRLFDRVSAWARAA